RRGGARLRRGGPRRRVREGDRLPARGRRELAPHRLLRVAARPDRGGHRARGGCLSRAGRRRCVNTLELRRPRNLGELFRDAWAVFQSHAWLFILLSAAVAIPASLVLEGIGQDKLTGAYDSSPSATDQIVPALVGVLVVSPIISAICIYALREIPGGRRPDAHQVLVAGFEAFTPLFAAV